MKRLLVMRHAKSSWSDAMLDDHERPLNGRGRRDAPRMGQLMLRLPTPPRLIVCSTASRCRETLTRSGLLEQLDPRIIYDERLYHAHPDQLWGVVGEIPAPVEVALLIAHNPGLEDVVSKLMDTFVRFPTAALAMFDFEVENWENLGTVSAVPVNCEVWRPKELNDV